MKYIAIGHNTIDPLNPYAIDKKGSRGMGRIRRHPDKLVIRVRDDAREKLAKYIHETVIDAGNSFSRMSEIELDSLSWLESNKEVEYPVAANSISEWHDDKYWLTMPVKERSKTIHEEFIPAAPRGLLLPIGLCDLVYDPFNS